MRTFFLSLAIGLIAGVLCFFLSVAFLAILLLIIGAFKHTRQDLTLAYRVAALVALFAALSGFMITLVRGVRSAMSSK